MQIYKIFLLSDNSKPSILEIFSNLHSIKVEISVITFANFSNDLAKNYDLGFIIEGSNSTLCKTIISRLAGSYQFPLIVIANSNIQEHGIDYLKLGASDVLNIETLRLGVLERAISFAIERLKKTNDQMTINRAETQLQNIHAIGTIADMLVSQVSNALDDIMLECTGENSKLSNKIIALKSLVKQVRDYSAIETKINRGINLQEIVQNCQDLLSRLIPSNVSLNITNNRSIEALIDGDSSQIRQAITNVIMHCVQQLLKGGSIRINFSVYQKDQDSFSNRTEKFIKMEIRDSKALTESEIDELFNPTLAVRKYGFSGLSLPSVYAIMKNHLGFITVESQEGKGTSYNLFFPKSEIKSTFATPVKNKNKGVILVIEDDYIQSEIMRLYLEAGGYIPEIKFSIDESLTWFSINSNSVSGVLIDSLHIDENPNLIPNLKTIKPDVRMGILSSPDHEGEELAKTLGLRLFLKPTSYPTLLSWLSDG